MFFRTSAAPGSFSSVRQVLLAVLLLVAVAAPVSAQQTSVTLEDVWLKYRFFAQNAEDINWMQDDNWYTELGEDNTLKRMPVAKENAEGEVLIEGKLLADKVGQPLGIAGYHFSAGGRWLVLETEPAPLYRHSKAERIWLFDLKNKQLHQVHNGSKVYNALVSPDDNHIAFVFENNLFIQNLNDWKVTPVTADGKENEVINGMTDWVHEEEFAFTRAFDWSADGKRLAWLRYDESAVPQFDMETYGTLYPGHYKFKYPKAGEKNASVSIHTYSLADSKKGTVALPGMGQEVYFPRMRWTHNASQLAIMQMNRHQNQVQVYLADAATGANTLLLEEKSETYIDEPKDNSWIFLPKTNQLVWLSDRSGYRHLYLYGLDGKLVRQITEGSWDVTEVYGLNEATGTLYYQSAESSPLRRDIYSIQLDGKKKTRLSEAEGWNEASFSPSFRYYILEHSTAATPPVYSLRSGTKTLKTLVANTDLKEYLATKAYGQKEFFVCKAADGSTEMNGYMMKPAGFDPKKKHPVLMFVYGGPGSQQVTDHYDPTNTWWHQVLAASGYVVVCVDNRGTGGRGSAFQKCTYMNLGKLEVEDQAAAAKYLGTLPYVDAKRIGIWGWSYGGYMTSLCLTKYPELFKAGIAVAPVTNWRYYDTIYTERYLRTPQENAAGYDQNSPINFAKGLKGNYLLVHGMADDNVHFQNAVEMTNALIKANVEFEHFFYPGKNHGIYGGLTRYHLFRKLTAFVQQKL